MWVIRPFLIKKPIQFNHHVKQTYHNVGKFFICCSFNPFIIPSDKVLLIIGYTTAFYEFSVLPVSLNRLCNLTHDKCKIMFRRVLFFMPSVGCGVVVYFFRPFVQFL